MEAGETVEDLAHRGVAEAGGEIEERLRNRVEERPSGASPESADRRHAEPAASSFSSALTACVFNPE